MSVYKFMHQDHAHHMMRGRLQFSRLVRFHLMEAIFRDDAIGDLMEGVHETVIDQLEVVGGSEAGWRRGNGQPLTRP